MTTSQTQPEVLNLDDGLLQLAILEAFQILSAILSGGLSHSECQALTRSARLRLKYFLNHAPLPTRLRDQVAQLESLFELETQLRDPRLLV
jgi:hypothetical protein